MASPSHQKRSFSYIDNKCECCFNSSPNKKRSNSSPPLLLTPKSPESDNNGNEDSAKFYEDLTCFRSLYFMLKDMKSCSNEKIALWKKMLFDNLSKLVKTTRFIQLLLLIEEAKDLSHFNDARSNFSNVKNKLVVELSKVCESDIKTMLMSVLELDRWPDKGKVWMKTLFSSNLKSDFDLLYMIDSLELFLETVLNVKLVYSYFQIYDDEVSIPMLASLIARHSDTIVERVLYLLFYLFYNGVPLDNVETYSISSQVMLSKFAFQKCIENHYNSPQNYGTRLLIFKSSFKYLSDVIVENENKNEFDECVKLLNEVIEHEMEYNADLMEVRKQIQLPQHIKDHSWWS